MITIGFLKRSSLNLSLRFGAFREPVISNSLKHGFLSRLPNVWDIRECSRVFPQGGEEDPKEDCKVLV